MGKKDKNTGNSKLSGNEEYPQKSSISIKKINELQDKLKESQEIFRSTLESISDPVFITDDMGNFTFICNNIENLMEYTPDEIWKMQNIYKLIGAEHFKLEQLRKKHHLDNIEILLNTKSGKSLVFLMNVKEIKIGDGTILFTLREVTLRKEAEAKLKESESRFKNLSEASFDAIFFSEQGVCIDQNAAAEKMFGYTLKEAVGKMGTDWIVPEDRDLVMKNMLSGFEKSYEVTALRKDGSTFACEIQARMGEFNNKPVRITTLKDISARKKAEAELKISELKYRSILDNATAVIFIKDLDGRYTYINKLFEDIHHVSNAEIIGNTDYDLFSKEEADQFRQNDLEVLNSGNSLTTEEIVNYDDGVHTVISTKFPLKDHNNNNYAVCGIATDITEQKEALDEIKTIWNVSPDLLCVADINTATFLKISPSFTKTLGYTEADLLGKTFLEFIHPDDVQTTIDVIENKLKKDIYVINYTNRYRCKDGSYKYLNWVSRPIVERGETYAIARDFTDQIIAEKKVEAAREISERYLQMAGSIIVSLNRKGEVLLTNKKAEEVLGYTREELVGKNWFDACIPKEVVPQVKEVFNKVITGKMDGVEHFDNDVVTKSGQIKTISWYNSYIRDDDGVIKHLLSSGIDITEIRKVQDELKKHRDHLEELVKERTRELEEKNAELEHYNKLFIGREFRIKELKDKIKELETFRDDKENT